MSNLAESWVSEEAALSSAIVVGRDGPSYLVTTARGRMSARRAAGCLMEPCRDDRVLVAHVDGELFVLSVLERPSDTPTRIDVDGELSVRVKRGRFRVAAQDGIDLTTAGDSTLTTSALRVTATEGTFVHRTLRVLAERAETEIGRARLVAHTLDTVAQRLWQRVGRSYRFVADVEQVRAGSLDYKAKSHARLHAEDTVVTAEKLVKIDGSQVHVG